MKLTEKQVDEILDCLQLDVIGHCEPCILINETKQKLKEKGLMEQSAETLESQVERLANFIMSEVDGEPSRNEGAVDCAIRIIKELQEEIDENK